MYMNYCIDRYSVPEKWTIVYDILKEYDCSMIISVSGQPPDKIPSPPQKKIRPGENSYVSATALVCTALY